MISAVTGWKVTSIKCAVNCNSPNPNSRYSIGCNIVHGKKVQSFRYIWHAGYILLKDDWLLQARYTHEYSLVVANLMRYKWVWQQAEDLHLRILYEGMSRSKGTYFWERPPLSTSQGVLLLLNALSLTLAKRITGGPFLYCCLPSSDVIWAVQTNCSTFPDFP